MGITVLSCIYQDVQEISQIPQTVIQQTAEFLELYNKNSNNEFKVTGIEGSERAVELLQQAIAQQQDQKT